MVRRLGQAPLSEIVALEDLRAMVVIGRVELGSTPGQLVVAQFCECVGNGNHVGESGIQSSTKLFM
jgi:hypothetical protein